MREVISTCPVCEHELSVTRLHCRECGTTLEGEFSVGRFSRLTRDQMRVLESFLRSRGNLREMERDLGLSYPTVRSRVDALVRSLGFVPFDSSRGSDADAALGTDPVVATERRRILESLARHEIDAEAAAAALRRLTSNPSTPAVVETAASATAAPSLDQAQLAGAGDATADAATDDQPVPADVDAPDASANAEGPAAAVEVPHAGKAENDAATAEPIADATAAEPTADSAATTDADDATATEPTTDTNDPSYAADTTATTDPSTEES